MWVVGYVQEAGRRRHDGGGVGLDSVRERLVERQRRRPLHPPRALLAVHHGGHGLYHGQQETMNKTSRRVSDSCGACWGRGRRGLGKEDAAVSVCIRHTILCKERSSMQGCDREQRKGRGEPSSPPSSLFVCLCSQLSRAEKRSGAG